MDKETHTKLTEVKFKTGKSLNQQILDAVRKDLGLDKNRKNDKNE